MPLPGRPRTAGSTLERRFHHGDTRYHGVSPRWRSRPFVFVERAGYTPGLQDIDARADTAAVGTIRRLYRQAVNYVPASSAFSWTDNGTDLTPVRHVEQLTRALRYKASTLFRGAGSTNSRFGAVRAFVPPRSGRHPSRVTLAAGNLSGRPVLRNRLSSFGSRVPTVNRVSPAAQPPKK